LALFLASQDNAENALCPGMRSPKTPPAALNNLHFIANPKAVLAKGQGITGHPVTSRNTANPGQPRITQTHLSVPHHPLKEGPSASGIPPRGNDSPEHTNEPQFSITEGQVSKDYRSFAANVFSTVAVKMLEWITPAAMDDMSRRTRVFQSTPHVEERKGADNKSEDQTRVQPPKQKPGQPTNSNEVEGFQHHDAARDSVNRQDKPRKPLTDDSQQHAQSHVSRPGNQHRTSSAKVRTPSGAKPKRKLSIDPFASEILTDEPYPGLLKSPRAHADKGPLGIKTAGAPLTRPISQLSSAGYFDDVTLEKMPPPKSIESRPKVARIQLDGARSSETTSPKGNPVSSGTSSSRSCSNSSARAGDLDSESEDEKVLPQSLSRLNAEIVDFICDIMQENGTAEKHMLEPPTIKKFHNRIPGQGKPLKRKSRHSRTYPTDIRQEWKLFVEQTIFYVLSDPELAIRSFSKKGQLYDSQTLWYCMLRMTRVAPSLIFHSLWMAASSLFAPPKSLHSLRSPTAKLFPKQEKSLSNEEAGRLLSICLHALVAAAPLVATSRELHDMSRIRSHGLILAGSGAVAQQPASLCLQYEDAFTNTLAMRLARRLFAAITTRRYFDDLNESNLISMDDDKKEPDVLTPLFSQLDFLNVDAVYVLNFSFPDRALHETRVPILLLDWARAVMLRDWDGSPEVPGDGPFGGALALIEAMYKKRQELLLGDAQFRSEYFADRMDTVTTPVTWLSHTPTRHKVHLLDFPYMFNPQSLVSYFRAINISRMSRAYEEATSLQDRVDVITTRATVVKQKHREELLERLQTAASKYLVINIHRESVIKDAFDELWRREERELLRPLKVHLGESTGEEGFDSGGVQQEFFRLAMAEALNPDYGAFAVDARTRMTWFVPGSMEPEWKFELIGMLVSLAVFNGLTLPVTFPKALYRKLLGEPVTELHHIADGWPDLANGLTALLEWDEKDGLVEDVFARTYEFSVSVFGEHVTREMKPPPGNEPSSAEIPYPPTPVFPGILRRPSETRTDDGSRASDAGGEEQWPQFAKTAWQASTTPAPQEGNPGAVAPSGSEDSRSSAEETAIDEAPLVTHANRNAYVSDYIRYLTEVSVRPQYEAFARGFRTCLHPKSLTLLTPSLLQSIVEGVQEIDINELKRAARYTGWDANHQTVRDFWSIVRKYDDNMKRKLLEFVTASDRLPVGGVKNVIFTLQRNGTEDEEKGRLPTAYTCYGILLLPEYKDKEMLRERLAMALENAQGFGFA